MQKRGSGTGSVRFNGRCWEARISLPKPKNHPEGQAPPRKVVRFEELTTDDAATRLLAETAAKETAAARPAIATTGETVSEWFERYFTYRHESLGHTSVRDDKARFNVWIKPSIGHLAMTDVEADDIEDIRDKLDVASRAWSKLGKGRGRISGKTAMNVWSCLVSAFKEAGNSKNRSLRVMPKGQNPCLGIQAPDRGKMRKKPYCWTAWFLQLIKSEAVPLEWRRLHAIARYTYLRPGELRVLTYGDVDLDAPIPVIRVTKAWDYQDEQEKPPKSDAGMRDVPIHPELMPLLKEMKEGKTKKNHVAPLLSSVNEDMLGKLTRAHLLAAGVRDPSMHNTKSTTHMPMTFRGWRDAGITDNAIAKLDLETLRRRAGHEDIKTTLGYVKASEDLTGGGVAPFPPLTCLLVGRIGLNVGPNGGGNGQLAAIIDENLCEGRDLNPSEDQRNHRQIPPPVTYQAPTETRSEHQPSNAERRLRAALVSAIRDGEMELVADLRQAIAEMRTT